jgi:lipoprotein-anchoring transpeptidase ErfK/SrfK
MQRIAWVAALCAVFFTAPAWASGSVVARIVLSEQRMHVSVDGFPLYDWAVSTARPGYRTPVGTFRPIRLARMWFSRKYDNSPMPHSIFFDGGYAVHGTGYVRSLGTPASHGCVRLHPVNAATLFGFVEAHGLGNAEIVITQ